MAEPKRYKDRWRVKLYHQGKQISVYGTTRKECAKKAEEVRLKLGKGLDLTAQKDTFGQWYARWEKMKAPSVSRGRMECYRSAAQNYLQELMPLEMGKIRYADVQEVFSGLSLSKSRMGDIRGVLNGVFDLAVRSRVIDSSPCQALLLPKAETSKSQRDALTPEEIKQVEELDHRGRLPAMIMLYAGLRPEEMIPLLWTDIDLEHREIHIAKSVERKGNEYALKAGGKTQAATRTVSIPERLCAFLRQEKKKATGLLVFPGKDGKTVTVTAWRRLWESWLNAFNYAYGDFSGCLDIPHDSSGRPIQKRCAPGKLPLVVRHITPYWFRHTYCTLLYQAGVDVREAMELMGHTRIETTLGIYTHLDKKYKRRCLNKLDEYISGLG